MEFGYHMSSFRCNRSGTDQFEVREEDYLTGTGSGSVRSHGVRESYSGRGRRVYGKVQARGRKRFQVESRVGSRRDRE